MNAHRSDPNSVPLLLFVPFLLWASFACSAQEGLDTQKGLDTRKEFDTQEGPNPEVSLAVDAVFDDIDSMGPGCAVGVVQDGTLTYTNGYGLANLDHGLPITSSSNFYLGSIGKQFTAAAVALAARDGRLSLDDDIRRWVPEMPEYDRTITVRHLIHHTSGLRDYLGLWGLAGLRIDDVHTEQETLALIARQRKPNFPTGDQFLYSNTGYFLLSVILERATGQTLREYALANMLGPLEMTRSVYHDDRFELISERVIGYTETAEGGYQLAHPWNFDKVGAGGVFSSIEELYLWDQNFYTEQVGGPGFTEQLLERGRLTDGTTIGYAFGLGHGEYRGLPTVSHGGALLGFRAMLMRFPEQTTTVLVLCNIPSAMPQERALRVADVVLEGELGPVAEPEATDESGEAIDVWALDEALDLEMLPALDQLSTSDRSSTLNKVKELSRQIMTDLEADAELQGVTAVSDFSDLVGSYYSPELEVTYRIGQEDGSLFAELPVHGRLGLEPLEQDRYGGGPLVFVFDRQEGGVRGFTVDMIRVRGVYFRRDGLY